MAGHIFRQIRTAVRHLNPGSVRELAERQLRIGLVASTAESFAHMEEFLAPPGLSRDRRLELVAMLHRAGEAGSPDGFDLEICEEGLLAAPQAFPFHGSNPSRTVWEILQRREELGLALARHFPPFRQPMVERIVREVARENAAFALLSSIPNLMPSLFALVWSPGEFASDTAFMTVNQVRMAFLIAAASDMPIGYLEQKGQIASIIAGAFGWRALARELAGKMPFGGGLIPKASIAYAGTYVMGKSLERYHGFGYGFTRAERERAYREALETGKSLASSLLGKARSAKDESGGAEPGATKPGVAASKG